MASKKKLEALLQIAASLEDAHLGLLTEVGKVLLKPPEMKILEGSDILPVPVAMNLGLRLTLFHALHFEKLSKKSFEYAFCRAWEATGAEARVLRDATNPGADITINGQPFSLKTEGAQGISRDKITISKLMEARWIRECLSGEDFCKGVTAKVVRHLKSYSRIIVMRSFETTHSFEYDIVEIPVSLLLLVGKLDPSSFSARTANGTSSAEVYFKGKRAFTIRLDGSVEKVTISNLLVEFCVKHGAYKVQHAL